MTESKYKKTKDLAKEIDRLTELIEVLKNKNAKLKLKLAVTEYNEDGDYIRDRPVEIGNILEKYVLTVYKDIETRLNELKEIFELL